MLSLPHVREALRANAAEFVRLQERAAQDASAYGRALDDLGGRSAAEVEAALAGNPRPGARPSPERVAGRSVVRPFAPRWANHAEARAWALGILCGVPVMAADGSQITPNRDYSVPVGAVQVGWFVNGHDPAVPYEKDLRFEVLLPEDAGDAAAATGEDAEGFPDLQVNVRRFEMECESLVAGLERLADRAPMAVAFFDGSFVISFAALLRPALRLRYVNAVRGLLAASERTGVPVVGYVDGSRSRDMAGMLHALAPHTPPPTAGDAVLLGSRMAWGDRSEAFLCARDDGLFERLDPALDYYDRVAFVYVKVSQDNPPARVEVPSWVLGAGLLERVVDVVRAECVAGTGYPYAMETADALAVITMADRERFYRAYQEFLEALGIRLRYARKARSKRQRR